MNLYPTTDKDVILYNYNNVYDLDKGAIEKSKELSLHYNPRTTPKEIKFEVVNVRDEFRKLSDKLTAKEIFLINKYLKK